MMAIMSCLQNVFDGVESENSDYIMEVFWGVGGSKHSEADAKL